MPTWVSATARSYRDRDLVVIEKGALLPEACVECGQPASVAVEKSVVWHNPAYYCALLLGVWPYVIVNVLMSKKMQIAIPYCSSHWKARVRMGWSVVALIVGGLVAGLSLMAVDVSVSFSVPWMLVLICCGLVLWAKLAGTFKPVYLDDRCGRFRGACPAFLETLPERQD